jgi:hypothetical protein
MNKYTVILQNGKILPIKATRCEKWGSQQDGLMRIEFYRGEELYAAFKMDSIAGFLIDDDSNG